MIIRKLMIILSIVIIIKNAQIKKDRFMTSILIYLKFSIRLKLLLL